MKLILSKKIILALGISGATTMAFADDWTSTNNMATNQWATTLTAQQFVNDAAVGGIKEVRLSELALERTQNEDVKHFAKHMINDHTKANEKLYKIATDEGLSFPPTNTFSTDDPNWSNPLITEAGNLKGGQLLTMTNLPYLADYQTIQHLQTLSGDQFDQSYAAEMVSDHTNTINEFSAATQNLSDKKLNKFASKTLPTLQRHYEMADKLAAKLDAMVNTNNVSVTNSTERTSGTGL